jgi:hypothetical protein
MVLVSMFPALVQIIRDPTRENDSGAGKTFRLRVVRLAGKEREHPVDGVTVTSAEVQSPLLLKVCGGAGFLFEGAGAASTGRLLISGQYGNFPILA